MVIVVAQMSFLISYTIYIGQQTDQIICKTMRWIQCGNDVFYRIIMCLVLLPVVYQKQLKNISYFSLFGNVATVIAIVIIIALEI